MSNEQTCSMCDAPSGGSINGVEFCDEHAEIVFEYIINIEAMEKGLDVDEVMRMALKLVDEIADRNPVGDDDD